MHFLIPDSVATLAETITPRFATRDLRPLRPSLFPKARQAVADSLDETFRRNWRQDLLPPTAPVIPFPERGLGPRKGP